MNGPAVLASPPMATNMPPSSRAGVARLRAILADVAVNILLPILVYDRLRSGRGEMIALFASSAPPLIWGLAEYLLRRRVDALSLLSLTGILLSILALFGGGGPRLLLLRERLVTGGVGLLFLGSAAIRRPLIYQLARAGEARRSPAELAAFDALRDRPLFRRTMLTMTLVWGVGLVAEAAVAVALTFTLSTRQYLLAGPILSYGTMGALFAWTFWLRRRRMAGVTAWRRGLDSRDAHGRQENG